MGSLINFIKGLFTGILGFFGGLLGGKKASSDASNTQAKKKKGGYFLELDESKSAKADPTPATSTPATSTPATSTPAAAAPAAAPSAQKSSRKEKLAALAKDSKKAAPAAAKAAPAAAAAKTVSAPAPKKEVQEVAFATKYLLTSDAPRRRPGANMSPYLDMARTMK